MSTVYHRPADPSGDDSYVRPLFADRCQAGFPSPATDYAEQELDLNSYCISSVNAKIIGRFSPFLMSAIGH
ncbi:ImpA UV protection protein [Shigella sonnei]|nr:ImpA UV protection protein [Shigella sonnei]